MILRTNKTYAVELDDREVNQIYDQIMALIDQARMHGGGSVAPRSPLGQLADILRPVRVGM